jgi:hypothetical protein
MKLPLSRVGVLISLAYCTLHKRTPLRETFSDSPPAVIRNTKPPWEKENTEEPGDTLRQELREKRSTLLEKQKKDGERNTMEASRAIGSEKLL